MCMIPNPDLTNIPVSRHRTFNFHSGASQPLRATNRPTRPVQVDRRDHGELGPIMAQCSTQLGTHLGRAELRHARGLDTAKRWRRLGSPNPHPL